MKTIENKSGSNHRNYDKYLIDLDGDQLKTSIYRVFPYDYFLESLINKRLTLVKPSLWDDPFEEFLAKQNFLGPKGEKLTMNNFGGSFFSQCWSFNKESDFMWRVYSPNNRGVKVKSDIKTLIDALVPSVNNGDLFKLGKVDYWNDNKIKKNFEDQDFLGKLLINGYYHSLLIKKDSFLHEREIRIIFHSNSQNNTSNICKIKIDPNFIFQEVELHPRLPKDMTKEVENTLRELGYKNDIKHSTLYEVPQLNLRFRWKKEH